MEQHQNYHPFGGLNLKLCLQKEVEKYLSLKYGFKCSFHVPLTIIFPDSLADLSEAVVYRVGNACI
jgi:hypothetical protein